LIPFNVPYVPEISKQYVLEALESNHQQGDGPFTAKASKIISSLVGGGHVLLTPSCTHALEMASMLANLGPGDEVILPSYTFTSAATAVTKFGATPVFVDIELETKGIDVNLIREAITPMTKAISWVNYAGIAPDIEGLQSIAKEFGLFLIEDNAHGLGGTYKGEPLGSFGDFATQSFHATKNIQCGEGGALVINNSEYIPRAEIIREKGTDRSKFMRGEVQKYQWVDEGSSYLLAEAQSAVLLGQLEEFTSTQELRYARWKKYNSELGNWCLDHEWLAPYSKELDRTVAHMYELVAPNSDDAEKFIDKMQKGGIDARLHYQSLDYSKFGKNFKSFHREEHLSRKLSQCLVRLPLFTGLSNLETETVIKLIKR
jgi:dTDP-4-amino-4,6-dideoxygalactose transaminase